MDLHSFLELERLRLAEERQRLREQSQRLNSFAPIANAETSMSPESKSFHNPKHRLNPKEDNSLSKSSKDWINNKYNRKKTDNDDTGSNARKTKKQDDMEQWVSDTFYSYFPGFNNEYQKRQDELQKKQQENRENLIKHQMLNNNHIKKKKQFETETSNINSARSINSSLTSNGENGSLRSAEKSDMEIINVNNPNYIPSKHLNYPLRPDSARHRLLQDLRHTNLTNLVNETNEDIVEINRRQSEIESARKKEYQQELMQQIEEKRRSIKILRDKEHQQEQVLTRRLQEQLKTMQLEEQLEKERIKAVKVRFDIEKNRLTRDQLLAKLENDSELVSAVNLNLSSLNIETDKENISNKQDNKVYKYFSNSEKHDYSYRNKPSSLPTELDIELEQIEMDKIERECFHLSEKICPMCDEPLKELENFCLRCQTKLSFRIKSSPPMSLKRTKPRNSQKSTCDENYTDKNSMQYDVESDCSFFLVCIRCERLYSWCKTCTSKSDICKACQNKRNLCMTCRKTLCSFCLEEVACGKDTENIHINDSINNIEDKTITKYDSPKDMSFQIVNKRECVKNDNKTSNICSVSAEHFSLNDLDNTNNPPYYINMEQNSGFWPDKQLSLFSTNEDKNSKKIRSVAESNSTYYNEDYILNTSISDDKNIEKLRSYTDKKLIRYLKNYGDLACQTRGTQTTPTTTDRRDIVIQGDHNLSIPLLREMPKMTRRETTKLKGNSKQLMDLQQRWDIPAVQKDTISPLSPKVVTQVGAIRKQLQIDRVFSEDTDS